MILTNNGEVKFDGKRVELLADLTLIMRAMIDSGIANKNLLLNAVDMACRDPEELDDEIQKKVREAVALASILFGDLNK